MEREKGEAIVELAASALRIIALIDVNDLDELIADGARFDAIGPIVTPSVWTKMADATRLGTDGLRIVRQARRELELLKGRSARLAGRTG